MNNHSNPNNISARMEKKYMKKQRKMIYTALEELDFHWDEREVTEFVKLWEEGLSLTEIAKCFSRDADEAALLLMDLCRKKRISPRRFGIERQMAHLDKIVVIVRDGT